MVEVIIRAESCVDSCVDEESVFANCNGRSYNLVAAPEPELRYVKPEVGILSTYLTIRQSNGNCTSH